MKPCDAIRPHLSALVDGALQPLEVIAIHRHLDRCPACRREVAALEQLKVRVHLAGRPPAWSQDALDELQRAVVQEGRAVTRRRRLRRLRRGALGVAGGLAAAAALWLALAPPVGVRVDTNLAGAGRAPSGAGRAAATSPALVRLDARALAAVVQASHPPSAGPAGAPGDPLAPLKPALLSFRGLPGGLVETQGERSRIVLASFPACGGAKAGAALAVLRADRLELPPAVRAALDARGVFVDVVQGSEVRVTEGHGELFILVRELDDEADSAGGAI